MNSLFTLAYEPSRERYGRVHYSKWRYDRVSESRGTIYPQEEQPKSSDPLDATPPVNSSNTNARHVKYLVGSPIHRLTGGEVL
ncbi:hypothetical protein TNCV_4858791 [Trichonephila clavipes]|nr:hypothetical protein TNCV_4858791 [Trichonephila clavipes]